MAENESLDLGSAHARRWDVVFDAVRKGESCEKTAEQVNEKLREGLRKALKQFAEYGVPLQTLLDRRNAPADLRQCLRQAKGHPYVVLLMETVLAEPGSTTKQLLGAFVGGVWDTISDQIAQNVVGSERWSNFVDIQIHLNEVRSQIEPEVQRIAEKLAADPAWMPSRKPDRSGDKIDPTAKALSLSLLGVPGK